MPTPANNTSDLQSPISHLFSTCPDLDDQAISQPPQSTRPSQPRLHLGPDSTIMRGDLAALRPTTQSLPLQSGDALADGRGDPEDGPISPICPTESEDNQKPTETDDDMIVSDAVIGEDSERITRSTRARTPGGVSSRRGAWSSSPEESVRRPHGPETVTPPSLNVSDGRLPMGVPRWMGNTELLGLGYEYADRRMDTMSPSSYLRAGSRFHGTQQSERQRYDVQVEIKHVDFRESFLCGYLRIQGLTEDHPTLTTYFEGEIIGSQYGFLTQHPSWGATVKDDVSHWSKFAAFRPFAKHVRRSGNVPIKDIAQRENIFMRWKEHFLVPDHRVRTISGASFEGFYYICFNQLRGEVSGIYFHSRSEKFQQLELKHVENKGCCGAMEFR